MSHTDTAAESPLSGGGTELGLHASNSSFHQEDPIFLLASKDATTTTTPSVLGVSAEDPLLVHQQQQQQQALHTRSLNDLTLHPLDLGASFDCGEDSNHPIYTSDEGEDDEVYQSPVEEEVTPHQRPPRHGMKGRCQSAPFDHPLIDVSESALPREDAVDNNNGTIRLPTNATRPNYFCLPSPASRASRSQSVTENLTSSYQSLSSSNSSSHRRLNRRTTRLPTTNQMTAGGTTAPSVISTSTSATSNSGSLRRPRTGSATNTNNSSTTLSTTPESPGLLASLDAGMAAVRRWIRSRGPPPPSPSNTPSRSNVRWSANTVPGGVTDPLVVEENLLLELGLPEPPPTLQHEQHPRLFQSSSGGFSRARQRAQSEPDAYSLRDFFVPSASPNEVRHRRQHRRRRRRAFTGDEDRQQQQQHPQHVRPQLSSSAAAALYTSQVAAAMHHGNPTTAAAMTRNNNNNNHQPIFETDGVSTLSIPSGRVATAPEASQGASRMGPTSNTIPVATTLGETGAAALAATVSSDASANSVDAERRRRLRWIQINRRFQFVITMVALLFSLLLFAILICWVVFTSAYVVSFDKSCDVPLKAYFWLVTLQLVLDVFRTDIMRCVFNWDANSNQRIPCRVIFYNVAYLLYALLVLRLGFRSVFVLDGSECRFTAPELYKTSIAFVTLSIAAWSTIVCGYLLPFCVVATLLTLNGYNPSSSLPQGEAGPQAVFPAAYSTSGAPPGCVEQLPIVHLDRFPTDYPRECCICMEDFASSDVVVETACKHVFHKQCCREWFRQARTCPVCRTDIPTTLEYVEDRELVNRQTAASAAPVAPRFPMGPTGRPVRGLLRMLQSQQSGSVSSHLNNNSMDDSTLPSEAALAAAAADTSLSQLDVEEGRRFGV